MHKRLKTLVTGSALAIGIGHTVAFAHHGWSGYQSEPVTLSGVIRDVGYAPPHGSLSLETPGKTWTVVLAPPSRMQARGLLAESLKPGTTASVTGYAHRNNPTEMRAERITIDGKTVELR